jgi:hypothetical protein
MFLGQQLLMKPGQAPEVVEAPGLPVSPCPKSPNRRMELGAVGAQPEFGNDLLLRRSPYLRGVAARKSSQRQPGNQLAAQSNFHKSDE